MPAAGCTGCTWLPPGQRPHAMGASCLHRSSWKCSSYEAGPGQATGSPGGRYSSVLRRRLDSTPDATATEHSSAVLEGLLARGRVWTTSWTNSKTWLAKRSLAVALRTMRWSGSGALPR